MECRLSLSSGPWSCKVSIRWEFGEDGKRMDEVFEEAFGSRITEKTQVELRIRQAQAAILNPGVIDRGCFLRMAEDQIRNGVVGTKALSFSRNVVCVDLEGPHLTDLSFIDLPGSLCTHFLSNDRAHTYV